jgi:hypothetical protein
MLNIDADFSVFNYYNFAFIVTSSAEIEALKEVYNDYNTKVNFAHL